MSNIRGFDIKKANLLEFRQHEFWERGLQMSNVWQPHVISLLPKKDIELFCRIQNIMRRIPEVDLGSDEEGEQILVSCHMVTRALENIFPGEVRNQDGWFARKGYEHSWLIRGNGYPVDYLVIDPYPIAVMGGPILVDTRWLTPWRRIYIKHRLGITKRVKDFDRHVRLVTRAMRNVC